MRSPFRAAVAAVALPGTGSDAVFARCAFGAALAEFRSAFHAVDPPSTGSVVACYRRALDRAARRGPVVVAGISLGAAAAVAWACDHPERTVAVLAALPAWIGRSGDAPAAVSARHTARQLRTDGIDAVTARMRADTPQWLGDALHRSWRAQWPHLPNLLEEAADYAEPTVVTLARCRVPVGIVGAVDDPVHPLSVSQQWAATLPTAGLTRVGLADIGADPAILGRRARAAVPVRNPTPG